MSRSKAWYDELKTKKSIVRDANRMQWNSSGETSTVVGLGPRVYTFGNVTRHWHHAPEWGMLFKDMLDEEEWKLISYVAEDALSQQLFRKIQTETFTNTLYRMRFNNKFAELANFLTSMSYHYRAPIDWSTAR